MKARLLGAGVVFFAAGACGGDLDLPAPATVTIVAETDGQQAFAGARLPGPLAAAVSASDGRRVPRAQVRWTVTAGTGAGLSDSLTVSDGTGRAEVVLTLGQEPGSYGVRATLVVDEDKSVSFSAVALDPPTLTGVEPATFASGDTIALYGANLSDSLRVEVGAALAHVLGASPAGDTLNAIVPPCLVPGTVAIHVLFGAAQSNAISGTYVASAGALTLASGEYLSLDPATLDACATFAPAGPSGAEYLVVPQSVSSVPGVTAEYRLFGDSIVTVVSRPAPPQASLPLATRFHDLLRRREAELARGPRRQLSPEAGVGALAEIKIGDRRDFHVCDSVPCSTAEAFTKVTAEVRYVGEHAAIYQDLGAPTGGLSDTDIQQLGSLFDQDLYEVATRAFGAESDVDRNGRVLILMTPVVNGLTPEEDCGTAIVTGFFFAVDVDAGRFNVPSNEAELFYTLAADPGATVSCAITIDVIQRLVPVTFVHELQHMISYHQHVLVRGGDSEALWLNEGLSHLSEELAGLHFAALGDDKLLSQFAVGDLFNAYRFLKDPGSQFVLFSEGTGTLAERGASWLFLRWLVDQFGTDMSRRLVETERTGGENVAAAVGEPMARLLPEWFLANYVSDLVNFAAPPRLRYVTWELRTTYGSLHDQLPQRFDRPFPIVPLLFTGGTFDVGGVLHSGSGDYVRVVQDPGGRGFTLRLRDSAGGPVSAAAVPRLNVIRIR
ncbi:MAG: hypothetical protein GTN62_14025 [Gemmatimonadales bacterium]|nr:hypothetical protein [Gemmatimonadales bacterium]NIN13121.1 hypothetical protein [Gemmatimonadales bacterium]NIN51205.1 hypothetical protein [Gemmatimonadales bacterium]NIP08669.1 hypothetical protein [Gemmatimonadales bacterium]NIR02357.1 hypothetical protein [Gemmatimonadales bacterium]